VRVTAQTRPIAENLEHIKAGCWPRDAMCLWWRTSISSRMRPWKRPVGGEGARESWQLRGKKKFAVREYTDAEYAEEVTAIEDAFCAAGAALQGEHRAMRIGTNHGSLSDRIMNVRPDTPLGMVESALEFARIARTHDFHSFVFSMKASNPKVMIEAYRLLVAKLNELGGDWNYPIHLGVTEAGDGKMANQERDRHWVSAGRRDRRYHSREFDGGLRVRDSVAQALVDCGLRISDCGLAGESPRPAWDPFSYERRKAEKLVVNGVPLGVRKRCGSSRAGGSGTRWRTRWTSWVTSSGDRDRRQWSDRC